MQTDYIKYSMTNPNILALKKKSSKSRFEQIWYIHIRTLKIDTQTSAFISNLQKTNLKFSYCIQTWLCEKVVQEALAQYHYTVDAHSME